MGRPELLEATWAVSRSDVIQGVAPRELAGAPSTVSESTMSPVIGDDLARRRARHGPPEPDPARGAGSSSASPWRQAC